MLGLPGAAFAAPGRRRRRTSGSPTPGSPSPRAWPSASRHPHTVWTVNDSGDSARVFAVDTRTGPDGRRAHLRRPGARRRGARHHPAGPDARRRHRGQRRRPATVVRVFWFDEPGLGDDLGRAWASWELAYPDGPHDAEALAVDPASGRVLVVTKDERPGGDLRAARRRRAAGRQPAHPGRHGAGPRHRRGVPRRTVPALAVRTYTSLHLLDPDTWRRRLSTLLPLQPQGETLALAPGRRGAAGRQRGHSARACSRWPCRRCPSAAEHHRHRPTRRDPSRAAPSGRPRRRRHRAQHATRDGGSVTAAVNRGELLRRAGRAAPAAGRCSRCSSAPAGADG